MRAWTCDEGEARRGNNLNFMDFWSALTVLLFLLAGRSLVPVIAFRLQSVKLNSWPDWMGCPSDCHNYHTNDHYLSSFVPSQLHMDGDESGRGEGGREGAKAIVIILNCNRTIDSGNVSQQKSWPTDGLPSLEWLCSINIIISQLVTCPPPPPQPSVWPSSDVVSRFMLQPLQGHPILCLGTILSTPLLLLLEEVIWRHDFTHCVVRE